MGSCDSDGVEIFYEWSCDDDGNRISVPGSYVINDLEFAIGCRACPEQYDVFNEKGRLVAYVRLRGGKLKCYVPDVGGKLIYTKTYDDEFLGVFPNEEDRVSSMKIMTGLIYEYYASIQNKRK